VRHRCGAQRCCLWPHRCTRHRPTAIWPLTVRPRQRWHFLALHWCPCPHCTGVIASIKLSLLPTLCQHCCRVGIQRSSWCHAGVCRQCARVLPASCWRHCQHRAVVLVAGVAPASSPLSRGCFCPWQAGIVALVAFALPPALQTGVCPITKQSRHALASLPATHHCCCRHSAGIVALVARASLPLSHWHCCPWHTRIATSITNWPPASHDAVATRCR
jgi:hypothetical protein